MPFRIRPYRAEDEAWVLACEVDLQEHERAIHDPRLPQTRLPGLPHSHDYMAMLWDVLEANSGIMLVAEDETGARRGLIAGSIVEEPWPMETKDSWRFAYVSDIYIEPAARGTGLAQQLLDALAEHFRAVDPTLTRLRINVLAANAIARHAYEKAGFLPYEVMYERALRPTENKD
jgi:GNAT superfamily N-acetyltransferase